MIQLVGLSGIPLIRELVKICDFRFGIVKILSSLVFGVVLNVALSVALATDWQVAVAVGLVAGFGSNIYNDIKVS